MGFVLLGLAVGNEIAFQGAVIQIVAHALSTGALFFLAGALQERLGIRDISRMGGLWSVAPRLGGASCFSPSPPSACRGWVISWGNSSSCWGRTG